MSNLTLTEQILLYMCNSDKIEDNNPTTIHNVMMKLLSSITHKMNELYHEKLIKKIVCGRNTYYRISKDDLVKETLKESLNTLKELYSIMKDNR